MIMWFSVKSKSDNWSISGTAKQQNILQKILIFVEMNPYQIHFLSEGEGWEYSPKIHLSIGKYKQKQKKKEEYVVNIPRKFLHRINNLKSIFQQIFNNFSEPFLISREAPPNPKTMVFNLLCEKFSSKSGALPAEPINFRLLFKFFLS